MFQTVLIANRGEIAVRCIRTLRRLGIRSVAVFSEADRYSMPVSLADEAICIGPASPAESYLRGEVILAAARASGAQAILPGYGFLSENAAFAEACETAGIAFLGPSPQHMRQFGLKHTARALAQAAGVPLAPGSGLLASAAEALAIAETLGYPVMLKSTAGGGGIGLRRCNNPAELQEAFATVQHQGRSNFGDDGVFVERFIERARHVEVQIIGDGRGQVLALGERDCSLQRRNQKVVEETPAPALPEATRQALCAAAVSLGEAVAYRSVGTVEFIYDAQRDDFAFLEVNTRLQVEHPITEAVRGLDLVEWMLRVGAGEELDRAVLCAPPKGHAIEVRVYAEDPLKNFQPSPGTISDVSFPEDLARVDSWVIAGSEVSAFYDPMLAKLIVHSEDRPAAIAAMQAVLARSRIGGIACNLEYLRQVLADPRFARGEVATRMLDDFVYTPAVIEVLQPGTYTTVQSWPGRLGYWDIGVPPSGPMDEVSLRLANAVVGNHPEAAALEITLIGPRLRFHVDAIICLSGAPCEANLDGEAVPRLAPQTVRAGQELRLGTASSGCRSYLAVRGGIEVPEVLGSRATFALGGFGGPAGRPLRQGDILDIARADLPAHRTQAPIGPARAAAGELLPAFTSHWEIGVLYGPHGAPDFFSSSSMESFFAHDWEVHYNSNRLGIRLIGPKPEWTREDGGEAGLHPSNIHDCEYAIGSINFTGDMPVILTKDGPSLGGFVCPVTIASAELWKVGQVRPGDRIRFVPISISEAVARKQRLETLISSLQPQPELPFTAASLLAVDGRSATVVGHRPADGDQHPGMSIRQAGDCYVLVEYGEMILDIALRLRIQVLMESLRQAAISGLHEYAPGVRSLQLRYDPLLLSQAELIAAIMDHDAAITDLEQLRLPSRILRLPMAFEDSATLDAVDRYRRSVRDQAPWLPNNVDFMQRINGLPSREAVRDTIFAASYLVLGLGDVYLGAPCAVPIDPRHRLLTSKYNPARTYTAEGTVGIGGIYMCIYGMDSPGGYQLVGRTLPIWNKHLENPVFSPGAPWLLRFFDQVQFYAVDEEQLLRQREDFRHGRCVIEIEQSSFCLADHRAFLAEQADDIAAFRERQQDAFRNEVAHWKASDLVVQAADNAPAENEVSLEVGEELLSAEIAGNVWKVLVEAGATVASGETLVILEAMKMEFAITAPSPGRVQRLVCQEGRAVGAGDPLVVFLPEGS